MLLKNNFIYFIFSIYLNVQFPVSEYAVCVYQFGIFGPEQVSLVA